jgi:hypothetical protein
VSALRTDPDRLRGDLAATALRLADAPADAPDAPERYPDGDPWPFEAPEAEGRPGRADAVPATAAWLRFAVVDYDADTVECEGGEVFRRDEGTLDEAEDPATFTPFARATFVPDTLEKADWVLRKIDEAERHALATEATLAGVVANLETEVRRARARADSLRRRFGPALEQLARRQLADHPRGPRSLIRPFGVLKLYRTPATAKVIDDAAALEWADEHAPELVQEELRRWVPKAEAKRGAMLMVAKGQLPAPPRWIEQTPPGERLVIESATEAGRKSLPATPSR